MLVSENIVRTGGRVVAGVLAAVMIGCALGCATETDQPVAGADGGTVEEGAGTAAADEPSGGDPAAAEEPEGGEDEAAGAATSELCAAADAIAADIDIVSMDDIPDPAAYPGRVAAAAERFATIEAPEGIEGEWKSVSRLFDLVSERLVGVTVETEEDLDAALDFEGFDAFGLFVTAPGFMEAIGLELQSQCGLELGLHKPVMPDICAAVDPVHLGSVFDDVPEGVPMRWSDATTDCAWQQGDREVALTVGDTAFVHDDLLGTLVIAETVSMDGYDIDVYDGALGPFRFAKGRTAYVQVGDTGVLVSVRTGDPVAEQAKAVALVGLVALDVPQG